MATSTKAALREQLLLARRNVADEVRAAEARMLGEHAELVVSGHSTVCAYVPVGTEPGSIEMLNVLLRGAKRVLLPVARTAADAGLVIVPALAIDHRGARLGRGRGFYDRSLPGRDPHARLIAVVRDDELVEELPAE